MLGTSYEKTPAFWAFSFYRPFTISFCEVNPTMCHCTYKYPGYTCGFLPAPSSWETALRAAMADPASTLSCASQRGSELRAPTDAEVACSSHSFSLFLSIKQQRPCGKRVTKMNLNMNLTLSTNASPWHRKSSDNFSMRDNYTNIFFRKPRVQIETGWRQKHTPVTMDSSVSVFSCEL